MGGNANSVAYIIDDEFVSDQLYGILGSIAGDDTIFVAVNPKQFDVAVEQLKKFFQKDI